MNEAAAIHNTNLLVADVAGCTSRKRTKPHRQIVKELVTAGQWQNYGHYGVIVAQKASQLENNCTVALPTFQDNIVALWYPLHSPLYAERIVSLRNLVCCVMKAMRITLSMVESYDWWSAGTTTHNRNNRAITPATYYIESQKAANAEYTVGCRTWFLKGGEIFVFYGPEYWMDHTSTWTGSCS